MRKHAFLALAIVAVGCSNGSDESNAPAPVIDATTPQVRAFESLRANTARDWTWIQHESFHTPTHLSAPRVGKGILAKGASVEQVTKAFLGEYKALFKMRDPSAELRMTKSEVDELAMTHARFQQTVRGVPVRGAEMMVHYDAAGRLTSLDATYVPDLQDLDVNPALQASEGVAIAKAEVLRTMPEAEESKLEASPGELVVFAPAGRAPALAYRTSVRAIFGNDPAIWVTTVDAKTGAILERFNNLQTIDGSGTGVLGDVKKLSVATGGTGYTMTDTSRGVTITTYTAQSSQVTAEQGATLVSSSSSTTWDTTASGPGAAVDAHFYAGVVYDYYKSVHGRNAIDGNGSPMLSAAHFGSQYDNAFWDGQSMSYGDGGQLFKPLSAGLDVCAHEFTHGVTQSTSNLDYQGQSGALNEAVSDIFGVFIEHSLKPSDTNNWLMGELIAKGSGTLRDFKNPVNGDQPDHMSKYVNTQQDNGGVHINSGIVNNADFLMTAGGKNPTSGTGPAFGIGWEKSEKVWYRVNTKYLTSASTFANAAQATMQAATDVGLTANESNIIDCAWKATGVVQGTCSAITDPSTRSTPQGGGATGTPSGDGTTGSDPTGATDGTDGTTDGTGSSPTAPATKKKRTITTATNGGCSAAGTASGTSGTGLFGLALALAALAVGRRKRA
jgi:Zn-dependent metalloprotease